MDLLKVIKFEGDDSTLVWKHPEEDFNTKSQLIVHESQEAILYRNGQVLDLFGPGKYELKTENIPLLRN
ncbi:MAG: SPFH domain-containing protein, partial [Methanobrevibacter sp.]|nr:SPFH domain-containing protein [Methanobrevibacter sp.]